MEEQKLECFVEGYEGTYFEVGQVWETREGLKLKVKDFDFEEDTYKVTLVELGDNSTFELYYTQKGEYWVGDNVSNEVLVKLITEINESEVPTESTPSEEPQPKTLSEYLKENNAYEAFIENCVGNFLRNEDIYKKFKENTTFINISNAFKWTDTKLNFEYWLDLYNNRPENLIYDMDEIIFAEVEKGLKLKAISENPNDFLTKDEIEALPTLPKQTEQSKQEFLVYVHGKNAPKHIHDSYDSAEKEAKRLAEKEIGCNVSILSIVKTFKSKVIVEEV